jgi:hypothetical protein
MIYTQQKKYERFFVKNDHVDEYLACGYCNSELKNYENACLYCGAILIEGYIDRPTRKLIVSLRFYLLIISVFLISWLYQSYFKEAGCVILVSILILISWSTPWLFFKIKNRKNKIWKKKLNQI